MITAKEAKELSNKNRPGYLKGVLENYLAQANQEITFVTKMGGFECFIYISTNEWRDISTQFRIELMKLGYKLSVQKSEGSDRARKLIISWGEK